MFLSSLEDSFLKRTVLACLRGAETTTSGDFSPPINSMSIEAGNLGSGFGLLKHIFPTLMAVFTAHNIQVMAYTNPPQPATM